MNYRLIICLLALCDQLSFAAQRPSAKAVGRVHRLPQGQRNDLDGSCEEAALCCCECVYCSLQNPAVWGCLVLCAGFLSGQSLEVAALQGVRPNESTMR